MSLIRRNYKKCFLGYAHMAMWVTVLPFRIFSNGKMKAETTL